MINNENAELSVDNLKLFVGKNYEYFEKKWAIIEESKSKRAWNWAAFFGGVFWMAYRKMYFYSWIFIGAIVVETLLEYAFSFPAKYSNALNIGISMTFGMQANYWYKLHVEKKIKEISFSNSNEDLKIELAKQGGTNIAAGIAFTVGMIALLYLVGVVAEG